MKILLIGGSGLVGSRFIELFKDEFKIDAPSHSDLDIINPHSLSEYLKAHPSEAVLNFSGFTNVDLAEEERDDLNGLSYKLNVLAVHNLAKICADLGKHLIHISTDYVFDGRKDNEAYTEEDLTNPVNWYGRTKLMGEEGILSTGATLYAIARIEMPYSATFKKKNDFARFFYQSLKEGKEIKAITDQKITPVFVDDCVRALKAIIENNFRGIIHVASSDSTTPFEYATMLAEAMEVDKKLIKGVKFEEFNKGRKASRPQHSWMSVKKFESIFGKDVLKSNKEGMKEFLKQASLSSIA